MQVFELVRSFLGASSCAWTTSTANKKYRVCVDSIRLRGQFLVSAVCSRSGGSIVCVRVKHLRVRRLEFYLEFVFPRVICFVFHVCVGAPTHRADLEARERTAQVWIEAVSGKACVAYETKQFARNLKR